MGKLNQNIGVHGIELKSLTVLVWVTIAMKKHQDQKQVREERFI